MNEGTFSNNPARFESIVGAENIGETPVLTAGGQRAVMVVSPANEAEAADCLKVCDREKLSVIPAGSMSWLDCGNPLVRADVVLSLRRMNRIVEYSPPDLTLTVESGLQLSALNVAARGERQWLPLDPPGLTEATVGAIVTCNSSGSLRRGFGTPRDYVIGLHLAHPDGTTSKSGGKVVKNVAGYDLNKLYVGSFGTLAVVTEITFKLRPLPESDRTVIIPQGDASMLFEFAGDALRSGDIAPASVFFLSSLVGAGNRRLAFRVVESNECVEAQVAQIRRLAESARVDAVELEGSDADRAWSEAIGLHGRRSVVVKISLPRAVVNEVLSRWLAVGLEGEASADLGTGVVRIGLGAPVDECERVVQRLRSDADTVGGTLVIEDAPPELKLRVDAWGDAGPAFELMRAVKHEFDPDRILNPGRFVNGI
jgi:glycolate oxidase FAD binding subunit